VSDRILATGEQLSAVVVAAALRSRGIDAGIAWPEEAGLIVDDSCDRITVDVAASSRRLRNRLRSRCHVIPGFYGVDRRGRIRLLGEGGSDYTATAVAACIDARSVHLWKDVPGVMSVDPKTAGGAEPARRLTYLQAAELARNGASVLHPIAVEPLSRAKIPLCVFHFDGDRIPTAPATEISDDPPAPGAGAAFVGVTSTPDVGVVRVAGVSAGGAGSHLERFVDALRASDSPFVGFNATATCATAVAPLADIYRLARLLREELEEERFSLTVETGLAMVAVVSDSSGSGKSGEGRQSPVDNTAGSAAADALAEHGVGFRYVCADALGTATYLLVDRADAERAVQIVHEVTRRAAGR
jgi:aspartate kinase